MEDENMKTWLMGSPLAGPREVKGPGDGAGRPTGKEQGPGPGGGILRLRGEQPRRHQLSSRPVCGSWLCAGCQGARFQGVGHAHEGDGDHDERGDS